MASLQRVNQGTWPVHAGSVPLLQCYGQSLEQKVFFASIASHITDPAAQIIQKFQTISAPGSRDLASQRHKYVIAAHLGIFGNFLGSSSLGYPPSTDGSVTDIGRGECVSDCYVPCNIPAAFPRDDGRTIRSQATVAESCWFLHGLDLGANHWPTNYVIDDAMPSLLASTRLTS